MCLPFQTIGAFDSALEALKGAGVELVDMDMSLLVDLGKKNVPDHIFYLYEMPREISRHAYNPPGRHMSWPCNSTLLAHTCEPLLQIKR